MRPTWAPVITGALLFGCQKPQTIMVDYSSSPVRFIVDHSGWPRPFWTPRVTEFALAGEAEESVWELKAVSSRGESAHDLAFVYGQVPPGFEQVLPENNEAPKPLKTGRKYFVAAGGPTQMYRMVFSLPLDPLEVHRAGQAASAPTRP